TGHGDADPADNARREAWPASDLRPRLAAVGLLEQAAARTAARHLILDAVGLPERGVHDIGIAAIDRKVHGAGLVIAKQRSPPAAPAVGGLEHTSLVTCHAVFAERRDEHHVGPCRVNAN